MFYKRKLADAYLVVKFDYHDVNFCFGYYINIF